MKPDKLPLLDAEQRCSFRFCVYLLLMFTLFGTLVGVGAGASLPHTFAGNLGAWGIIVTIGFLVKISGGE